MAVIAHHRRWIAGAVFAAVTTLACLLLGRLLTGSSWPLAHARLLLVVAAGLCYFVSFVARARGWRRLFPREECPGQARCLASVGAAAASGVVLPFRLDYLIKIGTLRRLGGVRISLEAIALSIISLGIVDAIAMLPLSISATATNSADLRGPLLLVVAFGIGCCILLLASARLVRLPLLRRSRRLRTVAGHISAHKTTAGRRNASIAALYLLACWTARALGSVLLLSALGLRFSPTIALCVICLSAAAGVVPITAGGLVVNVGATAAILLTLGVGKDIAINFSLASGLLITSSAALAAVCGAALSIATLALARRRAAPRVGTHLTAGLKLAVGDIVVYRSHGAGPVTARESRVLLGKRQEVIVLALARGLRVELPLQRARELLRPLATESDLSRVQEALSTDQALSGGTWLKRRRESLSSLNAGDPIGLAHIIRNSARRQAARSPKGGKPPQSLWERQIAAKARSLLSTEIAFARDLEPDEANSWIDRQLGQRP